MSIIADISTSSISGCLLFNIDNRGMYRDIMSTDVNMGMYGDIKKDVDIYKNVDLCSRKIL